MTELWRALQANRPGTFLEYAANRRLAFLALLQGNFQEALERFETDIERNTGLLKGSANDQAWSLSGRAKALKGLEKSEEAIDSLKEAQSEPSIKADEWALVRACPNCSLRT